MFESHGGLLSGESFSTYCLPYLDQIARRVKENLTKEKLPVVPMVKSLNTTNIIYIIIILDGVC